MALVVLKTTRNEKGTTRNENETKKIRQKLKGFIYRRVLAKHTKTMQEKHVSCKKSVPSFKEFISCANRQTKQEKLLKDNDSMSTTHSRCTKGI